jgi:hypothetical protein
MPPKTRRSAAAALNTKKLDLEKFHLDKLWADNHPKLDMWEERQQRFKNDLAWLYDNCKDKVPWQGNDAYNKVQEIFDKWKSGGLVTEDPSGCEAVAIKMWGPSFKAEVVNTLWEMNHPKNDKLTKEHVELLYDTCDEEPCPVEVQKKIDEWPEDESDITEIVAELNEDVWGQGDGDTVRYTLWSKNITEYPFLIYEHVKYLYSKNKRDITLTQQEITTIGDFFNRFPRIKSIQGGGRKSSKRKSSKRKKASKKKRNTKRRRQR